MYLSEDILGEIGLHLSRSEFATLCEIFPVKDFQLLDYQRLKAQELSFEKELKIGLIDLLTKIKNEKDMTIATLDRDANFIMSFMFDHKRCKTIRDDVKDLVRDNLQLKRSLVENSDELLSYALQKAVGRSGDEISLELEDFDAN